MKKCTKCLCEKSEDNFCANSKAEDGLFVWCKDCQKKDRQERYYKDIEKSRAATNARRLERFAWIQKIKSQSVCKDCGMKCEPFCMDYDHRPGEIKVAAISKMVSDNTPKEEIFKEIEKCDLICLLCHNKRTYDRNNITPNKYKPHQQRNIDIINKFKNQPCSCCKTQYESYNMQIDHIDPSTKLYDVCQLKSFKEQTLLAELAKCQPICAMCHRRKSIFEQQSGTYVVAKDRIKPPKKEKLFYDEVNGVKECGLCHEIKPTELFSMASGGRVNTYCRKCFNKYKRDRRKETNKNENKKQ